MDAPVTRITYSCVFVFTGGVTLEGVDKEGTQQFNDYNKDQVLDSLEAFANLFHDYSDVFLPLRLLRSRPVWLLTRRSLLPVSTAHG